MRLLVMGVDVLAASRPATPVQLAHACQRLGYDAVVPASWGDELAAAALLDELSLRGARGDARPVVLASCPHVARRVLATGDELRDQLLAVAPPPLALARYLRTLAGEQPLHLTWTGQCPAAASAGMDEHLTAEQLTTAFEAAGIDPTREPLEFEDVLPPDRRRHFSRPGGLPAREAVSALPGDWRLVEVPDRDLVTALAGLLLCDEPLAIDIATRTGCSCAGARGDCGAEVRDAIEALEPPRSRVPVVDHSVDFDRSHTLPPAVAAPPEARMELRQRVTPATASSADVSPDPDPHAAGTGPRHRNSPAPRTILGATPTSRTSEGRTLPRAYVARRRHTARSEQVQAERDPRLYGGHSGPLGRLSREDTHRPAEDDAMPSPSAAWSSAAAAPAAASPSSVQIALLFAGVALAGVLVGTLMGWLLRS